MSNSLVIENTTLHSPQTELVPLDTEHWYMPESSSNRPYTVMLDPLISTSGTGNTSPFLYHIVTTPTAVASQVKETLVPTELSKLSPGLEVIHQVETLYQSVTMDVLYLWLCMHVALQFVLLCGYAFKLANPSKSHVNI